MDAFAHRETFNRKPLFLLGGNMKRQTVENEQQKEEKKDLSPSPKQRKNRRIARVTTLVTVIALAVGAIVGLSVALHYSNEKITTQARYQREMESVRSRAYYNLLDGANDIDATMSKFVVANSPEKQQALLYEIWGASSLAGDNLSAFDGESEGVQKAAKFINQLGDYSLCLAKKISDGKTLDNDEIETISKLRPMTSLFKSALQKASEKAENGNLSFGESIATSFVDGLSVFAEPSLDYPEMIYDGPFSDAVETRRAKALETLPEIDEKQGEKAVLSTFPDCENLTFIGRFDGRIPTLNYSFTIDGIPAYVQLSVKGGKIVNYTLSAPSTDDGQTTTENGKIALEFSSKLGYKNMQIVWSATADGYTFVNLAPTADGVILYPDLVKVKLTTDGKVVGFDSAHYQYNHIPRTLPRPAISETAARKNLPTAVSEGKLALIPQNETAETLCYEYELDGGYFVYIDAMTGKETEIFYVVDGEQGEMLM